MTIRLSKSRLTAFRQCPKRLWLEIHRPDLKVEDESARGRFAAGHRVGELAQAQYPDGIMIAPDNNLTQALSETRKFLGLHPRKVLFEATFQADGLLVRADLLIPVEHGWHMVEVKSSTQVKDYHVEDAAIQSWVASKAGLALAQTSLQLVDSQWTYPGGNYYAGLLKSSPVDDAIGPLLQEVPKWLVAARDAAAASEPSAAMGKQCNTPFSCSFQAYCETLNLPVEFPIAWLPNLHYSKRARYEAAGFLDLRDIPADELTDKQRRVLQATLSNQSYFEPLSTTESAFFNGTRYYLDFETITFTVPIWGGTRPHQQVPFQWSCHIETPAAEITHDMFLDLSGEDPSRAFAESLVRVLGQAGPIIVYNQGFEKRIMRELAARFSDLAQSLTRLLDRVVDLLPLVHDHFYHPDMHGSWSIKAVLPAMAPELDYAKLDGVSSGTGAQNAYSEAINTATTPERKAQLDKTLREYCYRDTQAMVVVLRYLMDGPKKASDVASVEK